MRYFIYLSYNGLRYSGWQIQPNAETVQETIERALETILRTPCPIVGAGRTDAGVHARVMVAHADIALELSEIGTLKHKLNRLLPPDISIQKIVPVSEEAHARFSAVSRTYRYYATEQKDPYTGHLQCKLHQALDVESMNSAAKTLLEYSDFTSFSKLHTDVKTNNCKVSFAEWTKTEEGDYVFTITADRFLRNMVRAIVGTLFLVGRGKLTVDGFKRIIEAKDRNGAGSSAPGHALFLEDVAYPDELFNI